MFKQPAGDPAEDFIIQRAGNRREPRRTQSTLNRNQLKGGGVCGGAGGVRGVGGGCTQHNMQQQPLLLIPDGSATLETSTRDRCHHQCGLYLQPCWM